jgi:RNA polymerase sigma-70 factor, ECF subfamily
MDLTDKEYVQRCRDGHPDEFRQLVHRYQGPLFSYLTGRMGGDRSQAEEAAQESFVRAFQSLHKLHKPESFYSWLLGIAGRVAKEQFRSHKRHEQIREAAETMLANADDAPGDPATYPLEEAIAVLPETYRQVILLRFYEELSCHELAQQLNMPLGTVTKTLSRAYALLRQELLARGGADQTINQTEHP